MDTIEQIKVFLSKYQRTIWTILVTTVVTLLVVYKFSQNNVVFISTPNSVKLEINDEFESEDSLAYLDDKNFVPKEPLHIAVHCTDSYRDLTKEDLIRIFKSRKDLGGRMGYNYVIGKKGNVIDLVPIDDSPYLEANEIVSGVKGMNSVTISVAVVGGRDIFGRAVPPFNNDQLIALYKKLLKLKTKFPKASIDGHRDLISKDTNRNGKIDPHEYVKTCPNFDVKDFFF